MLSVHLLGAPALRVDNGELYVPSQKAQALLFFLAAEYERSFSRTQIITMLWEESSEREGRNSLSTVLSRLRSALPLVPLRTDGDLLAWKSSDTVTVDLHQFRAALVPARSLERGAAPAAPDIHRLETAVTLYRGPFLDGFTIRDSDSYEEWLRVERERWQQRWLNAVELLIDGYSLANRWAPAIEWGRRAVSADPLQERFHRALMRLHTYAGDRAAALAQFRQCSEMLDQELGVEPDAETQALHQAILSGSLERPRPAPPAIAPPVVETRPPSRLAARLVEKRRRSFVGRDRELSLFADILAEPLPRYAVLHVVGSGGVGKTSLLSEFARFCEHNGVTYLQLDGRNIQPTPDGMLNALREVTGADDPLSALPGRHVLLMDTYELLAPIDSWLREQFLPQLPEQALAVIAGRNTPTVGWRADPAWQEVTHIIQLGNLNEHEAVEYLTRRGIAADKYAAVLRFTRGYPLALSLAAEVLLQRPEADFETSTPPDIIRELVERFVVGVPSVGHRAALEACAQVRVLTEPLLAAMLAANDARELFEWLRDLSFISSGPRGLLPHDLAREAIATDMRWRNPPWHAELHRRARSFYMQEFARLHDHAQYLVLLDLIFLHDHPLIRSIFTWNEIGGLVEDRPRPEDWPILLALVNQHEGAESARIASGWFARQPEGVTVFRDGDGAITGFSMFATLRPDCADIIAADPCAAMIQRRLNAQPPLAAPQIAVINRFWMDSQHYQGVSPTQGMIFVAATRFVLTTTNLAYSFHTFAEPDFWQPAMEHVRIHREPAADFTIGTRQYGVFYHDWRSEPPQAWLEFLAEREVTS